MVWGQARHTLLSTARIDRYMKFGMTERDLDDVKHMFSDMSIKILGLTYIISMLHMLFDVLAFKNDIGFFKVLARCPVNACVCRHCVLPDNRKQLDLTRPNRTFCDNFDVDHVIVVGSGAGSRARISPD